MGWVNWSRKASEPFQVTAGTVGIDLNSTRLRAMSAEPGRPPRAIALDEGFDDLPLTVSLEKRQPAVGRAALLIERQASHLLCTDFLNDIGLARVWESGRHKLTANDLLALVFDRFQGACPKPDNVTLTVPVYLTPQKVTTLAQMLERRRIPVRGSALMPLALVAAADASERRPPFVLLVDVDDHALTGSLLHCESLQARILGTTVLTRLNLRAWKDRLLNGVADRCVRVCRRDPRDSAQAEQSLFEQIDASLDVVRQQPKVDLIVRSTHWYQDLILQADDFAGFCAPLVKPAISALNELVQSSAPEPPQAVWLTHAAGRLPGLAEALHAHMAERTGIAVLPAEAGARAALTLATRCVRDELPRTHLDGSILLPEGPMRDQPRPAYRETNNPAPAGRTARFDR